MECLLCLETWEPWESGYIKKDSFKWHKLNIERLINKHLRPMESLLPAPCICLDCWQELYDFHKFYERVEEAQIAKRLAIKTEPHSVQDALCKTKTLAEEKCGDSEKSIEIKQEPEEFLDISENRNVDDEKDLLMVLERRDKEQDNIQNSENEEISDSDDSIYNGVDDMDDDGDDGNILIIKTEPYCLQECIKPKAQQNVGDHQYSIEQQEHEERMLLENNDDSDNSIEVFENSDDCNDINNEKLPREATQSETINEKIDTLKGAWDKLIKEHFELNCYKCKKTFDRFLLLRQHMSQEHNEIYYVSCCSTQFFNRSEMVDHINYHRDPEIFKCSLCDEVFKCRKDLKSHMRFHNKKTTKGVKKACNVCGELFHKDYLLKHKKYTHFKIPKQYPYTCSVCNIGIRGSSRLTWLCIKVSVRTAALGVLQSSFLLEAFMGIIEEIIQLNIRKRNVENRLEKLFCFMKYLHQRIRNNY
ncbi:uncharacterized protein isoform X2 [Musca autumnalis]